MFLAMPRYNALRICRVRLVAHGAIPCSEQSNFELQLRHCAHIRQWCCCFASVCLR